MFAKLKLLVFITFMLLIAGRSHVAAQSFGNEWINHSQKYYRIPVAQDGLYRIFYNAIIAAGIPSTTDPRQFQLFYMGEEQYIYVRGENDGILHTTDFIEFYGKRNTAQADLPLFHNPGDLTNEEFSFFNDTSCYFLTYTPSITNKRMVVETDVNYSSYGTVPYIMKTSRVNYTSTYFAGKTNSYGTSDFEYTAHEGWFDVPFQISPTSPGVPTVITKNISTAQTFIGGPNAVLDMKIVGASNYNTAGPNHHLVIQYPGATIDTLYQGYTTLHIVRNINPANLGATNSTFSFTLPNDLSVNADRNTISYISIKYPHTTNMENTSKMFFHVPNSAGAKSVLQLSNINVVAGDSVFVWDFANKRRIKMTQDGSNYKGVVLNGGAEKDVFLSTGNQITTISSLTPVNNSYSPGNFPDYSDASFDNVDYIIITHKTLMSSSQQYATYRTSTGFNVLLLDVEPLYDQFSYGIRKHPLGIRNFLRFGITQFADTIHGLFLIGKGYKAGEGSSSYRLTQQYYNETLLPSIGNPPSDIMFTSRIVDSLYMPAIPTGRLSVRTNTEIARYLIKVTDYEFAQQQPYNPANPTEKEWMKNVLHFAGGSSIGEGLMLETYLNVYKDSIEAPFYGGYVRTFKKNTTDPMQQIVSDSLKTIINNGVSILNFFGHAAGIGFDISIDNPSEYNNYKKYFFILANSCLSGDLFQPTTTSSETFVLIENKGAIAYLGSTTNALAAYLHSYSLNFIGLISYSNYGKSIGSCMQGAIQRIQNPINEFVKEISYSMMLHGDPVLVLNAHEKPDYVLSPPKIQFNPAYITTEIDSFEVWVISTNLGKAVQDSMFVQLTRVFPDNSSETYLEFVKSTIFTDTIKFIVPVDISRGVGLNIFTGTLDAFTSIDEISESNNTASTQQLIISSDIVPVYPYEYAVLPDTLITLIASTGNPLAGSNTYIFQIDTTDTFDSPFMQSGNVNSTMGGIIEWPVPFPTTSMPDSTVYYWRTSAQGSSVWRESSFQYIPNKRGWGQSHFFQFKNDNYYRIVYKRAQRTFSYDTANVWLSAQTGYYPNILWSEEWFKINGILKGQWSCTNYNGDGMKFVVFDPITLEPWMTPYDGDWIGPYENLHCRAYDYWDFDYYSSSADSATQIEWHLKMAALLDTVPNGYYVLAFSHRNHNAQNYPEELYQGFESIGSGNIRTIQNNLPYMIFGIKGAPIGSADESLGLSITSIIKNDYYLPTNFNSGSIESTMIGPASEWGSLHWKIESSEAGVWTDTTRLFVLGINSFGNYDTLIGPLPPVQDSLDILNLSQRIDASQYPYLRLYLETTDDTLLTPSQLVRWHVLYEGIPETAISPNIHFAFYNDTVQQGEVITLSIATKNISIYDFSDSLMVSYWVLDRNRQAVPIDIARRICLHPSGHTIIDSVSFSTDNLPGLNSLWVEFNPVNPTTSAYDQLEQYHFNNIAEIPFYVGEDRINPILDVTFDGVRILDGDIVSARPEIQILLKDENRYLLYTDSSVVKVFLQRPGSDYERIWFISGGVENMYFYPSGSTNNNTARVEFPAVFAVDGIYRLRVQAIDVSGNESGDNDFVISFKVVNKSTITEVMNWPNPFSTRTHFVFTLTGSVLPDFFMIQIMTITGKVVREIDMSELGPIHIGRNITQYAWDGRDQYGDQLANGVYLYRVITKINGQDIERNATEAAQYFTQEFGKMVLIR